VIGRYEGQWEKNKRPSKDTHNCITRAEPIEARNEPTMHEQGRGKERKFIFLKKYINFRES
jgi:hypothetical protein